MCIIYCVLSASRFEMSCSRMVSPASLDPIRFSRQGINVSHRPPALLLNISDLHPSAPVALAAPQYRSFVVIKAVTVLYTKSPSTAPSKSRQKPKFKQNQQSAQSTAIGSIGDYTFFEVIVSAGREKCIFGWPGGGNDRERGSTFVVIVETNRVQHQHQQHQ